MAVANCSIVVQAARAPGELRGDAGDEDARAEQAALAGNAVLQGDRAEQRGPEGRQKQV